MIADSAVGLEEISEFLDALSHEARWDEIRDLTRSEQRELYGLAHSAPPLTADDFVPRHVPDLVPVAHRGRNSLPPLLSAFRQFQKIFCRPEGAGAEGQSLFGYNEGASRPLIGPGYFVALPTESNRDWERHGGVVIDYHRVPDGPVPHHWPRVRPNSHGLQVLVYDRTRDFMRRISSHVTVGAAFKFGTKLDHYFVLNRMR